MSVRFVLGRGAVRLLCTVAGGALVLAGCASNTEGDTTAVTKVSVEKVDALAAAVPDKVKQAGKLVVGVNVPYQPNEYKDASGKIVGFDVDLLDAVATTLGLKVDYVESAFEKIIPAIQAGTYDVGMSSITDSREREQQVDFTTYFSAGIQWAQQTGKSVDPNNACGKRVAVQATTVEHTEEIPAKSAKCVAEGKPPIDMKPFDEQSAATNALVLGQVDAMSADSPVTAYAIKQSEGKIEATGPIFDSAPYGWAVQKGSPLAASLQKALQHLIDNGKYGEITTNWGVQEGQIKTSVINGAVS
ncbi:ABC transporter substrate-binding protein [Nocardia neocaledoniensis NBRC 108232]|uniref:Amino acid ABC transporter substrate-binding protein (PAAT family) n=1 Tax=Nocardia neocaledoniensis TaxID=236511 RepID=A0A317NAP6_9NOCA|nr:ABC transporter substrate-binding protein [Nocardia neocaledoniensis]PWV70678.1 amino acid ABC transporter substrate-binding protein (PAAT family) [Nocardia neocaledoniensis]GEM32334.1 ABC transporter substrate-binding protein [Nocardia neocaledoniensis NBRC 108232]